jgi:predicted lipoprotein with Yx(FWY)xxD motif
MRSHPLTIHSLSIAALLGAAAIVIAACSGSYGGGSTAGGPTTSAPPAGSGAAMSTQIIGGRTVLVTAAGLPVYASDEERAGDKVLCVSSGCLGFWKPVIVAGGTATGTVAGQPLGVITRPDGARQVTLGGVPLYTFANDSSGQINGDGLSDTFDGQTLTWHVMTGDGAPAASGDADPPAYGKPGY